VMEPLFSSVYVTEISASMRWVLARRGFQWVSLHCCGMSGSWCDDMFCLMPSAGMWRRVASLRTDVPKERVASIFRVEGSLLLTVWLPPSRYLFYLDYGENTFLRNVGL
jgi:hypothetical protein